MVNNYNNGKIYKIIPNIEKAEEGEIYIGSTTNERLCQRMTFHRNNYKKWKDGKTPNITRSYILFEKYSVKNCSIILIEEVNCETKDQLLSRERYYIESTKCLNKCIPTRTIKEWYEDNKDKIKASNKQYRENNKDEKQKYDKQYREVNKDKIKEYREDNKDKIKISKDKPFICECGSTIRHCEKARHYKTKKHINFYK